MEALPQLIILGRTMIAMLLGGLIGLERELGHKQAGFRTHMIVSATAALLMGMSEHFVRHYHSLVRGDDHLGLDPIRMVQALIMGISVLAGGAILRDKNTHSVMGLTTVVSLLLSCCIGIASGTGLYIVAAGVTVLGLLVLLVFHFVERNIMKRATKGNRKQS